MPQPNSTAAIAATIPSETNSVGAETIFSSGTTATAPSAAPARSNAYTRPTDRTYVLIARAMTTPAAKNTSADRTAAIVSRRISPLVTSSA